ncbi:uncharacterized protein K02A2.6-like, partial [Ahaetulla prasina]|uniref:uncharacterized protein K02A2.6-like n=1 Tax=Ahaetulla prasina TaxID=499056 RepID=UPI002647B087
MANAAMTGYTPPAPFDPAQEKWGIYMTRFESFLEANELQGVSDNRKRAYFLSHCGSAVIAVAEALAEPTPLQSVSWQTLQSLLKNHFAPAPSKYVRRYEFGERRQQEGESISDYMAALRQASKHCEYRDLDEELLEQLIRGVRDIRLRRRLLAKSNLTLANALDEARAHEMSTHAADTLQKRLSPMAGAKPSSVHHEGTYRESTSEEEEDVHYTGKSTREDPEECGSCGGRHQRQRCKFRDAICRRCERKGHLAQVCRAPQPSRRKFKSANQSGSESEMQTPQSRRNFKPANQGAGSARRTAIGRERKGAKANRMTITIDHAATHVEEKIFTNPKIEGVPCQLEVDTGSAITIMSWDTFVKALPHIAKRKLQKQRLRVQDYQGNRIPVRGTTTVRVEYGQHKKTLPITLVEGTLPSLLGLDWFRALGMGVTGIHRNGCDLQNALMEEFAEVFEDRLGKYKGTPISFNLDPQVAPIRLKARRVPFALKPKIDREIDKLVSQGILVPVDHAKWETPIVTPIKPDGSIRICADYKATLNKALQKSAYPVPVVQHLLHSLGHGQVFAKLDLAQAYQQLPVDASTAEAQTIVTHRGAFKCTRLQFGVSAAPGLFQNLMERLLQGLPGVVPYFDDVLISGENLKELGERLRKVLVIFRSAGLKVKAKKCQIGVESVEFLGYRIDKKGIHPTESKVKAIKRAPAPKNKTELQAFLGLENFYAVFLRNKATSRAFEAVKDLLSGESLLIQYNSRLPLVLVCDASPYGVGAVLSHRLPNGTEAPIAFYSRTMSPAERNYSQLDREALAIVSGVKKFHEYVFGRDFEIVTDHRPLLGLLAGDRPTPVALSPRLTRWTIFLAAYSYKLQHRPGKELGHADARGWPAAAGERFKEFVKKKGELSVQGGCLLWGDRVVVPEKLRKKVLELLHEGHPGIVRMKGLARSYVWWPLMDREISDRVGRCQVCQESRPLPPTAPVLEWEKPQGPWSRIHIDFAGPFHGQTFLIVVDAFSKWLEIILMKSTTAGAVISALKHLFATHGLPDTLVSDNGPQFTAALFEGYLAEEGIRHALSAPFHPAS